MTTDNYQKYTEYNHTLRAWFVAFGIGGLALFVTNPAITPNLYKINALDCTTNLLLIGVFLQILMAFVNKVTNWYIYRGEVIDSPNFKDDLRYKLSASINKLFILDIVADIMTGGAFCWAIYNILNAYSKVVVIACPP